MSEHEPVDAERLSKGVREAGIGTMLRAAREQLHLTVPDLAYRVRLEPRIVRQLENGEFERLPAPAFVRGYLRGLAKELALDGAALIAMYDAQGTHDAPGLNDFESRAPLQITSSSNVVRYTTVAVVVAMIALVVLWWRSHSDSFSLLQILPEPLQKVTDPGPATPPLSYSFEVVTHPDEPSYRAPDPDPTSPSMITDAVATPAAEPARMSTIAASASAATAALPANTNAAVRVTHAAAAAVNSETAAVVAPLPAPGPTPADLVLNSSADAWVQIIDGRGERLYYNLVRPGHEVRLGGRHPYQLVIGNAPAVRLLFAGRAIDVARLATDGVAHLQLGRDGPASQETIVDEH